MKPAQKKREYMTSLSGSRMVIKTHRRIVFRGIIDSLEAEVIEAQVLAGEQGEDYFRGCLGEVLEYLRVLMAAEVKESPLPPPFLFGLDAEELHRQSHNSGGDFVLPSYTQGPLAARLNFLRAKIREAELSAVKTFGPGEDSPGTSADKPGAEKIAGGIAEREDIILAMNRLSSALWWLFRKYLSLKAGAPA